MHLAGRERLAGGPVHCRGQHCPLRREMTALNSPRAGSLVVLRVSDERSVAVGHRLVRPARPIACRVVRVK